MELLVVIAIIGVLVGLLLPAVQAARESSRRSSCSNNLRQMSLGVLNFESAKGRFPAGLRDPFFLTVGSTPTYLANRARFSFITLILPFMEEVALGDQLTSYLKASGAAAPWNTGPLGGISSPFIVQPKALLCPSERTVFTNAAEARPTSYRCNRGDIFTASDLRYQRRGPFGTGFDQNTYSLTPIKVAAIPDGLSKTVMLGEVILGDLSSSRSAGTGLQASLASTDAPGTCASLLATDQYNPVFGVGFNDRTAGRKWGDSLVFYTGFFTATGPNTPRCGSGESLQIVPVSSYHAAGAQVSMCDGSVRFISDSIDAGDATMAQPSVTTDAGTGVQFYTGPSLRGVWGAMGTIAGSEPIATGE